MEGVQTNNAKKDYFIKNQFSPTVFKQSSSNFTVYSLTFLFECRIFFLRKGTLFFKEWETFIEFWAKFFYFLIKLKSNTQKLLNY